jgi:hypothetical protein
VRQEKRGDPRSIVRQGAPSLWGEGRARAVGQTRIDRRGRQWLVKRLRKDHRMSAITAGTHSGERTCGRIR